MNIIAIIIRLIWYLNIQFQVLIYLSQWVLNKYVPLNHFLAEGRIYIVESFFSENETCWKILHVIPKKLMVM